MFLAQNTNDYQILDTGDGHKLERWGDVTLSRPDPQVIWPKSRPNLWQQADAVYARSSKGGGAWTFRRALPESWRVNVGGLSFVVRPTGFKHTGLFPEQSANWEFLQQALSARPGASVLNLFAYTGGATLACLKAGASVVHVDAAKGMVQWAKENAESSGLAGRPARYIVDDCLKFVLREQRRGHRYDGIIMDPPSYGRGADGQIWKVETNLFGLVEEAAKLLSDRPLFFLISSYTTGLSDIVAKNMLELCVRERRGGVIRSGTLAIPVRHARILLPCGNTARWMCEETAKNV